MLIASGMDCSSAARVWGIVVLITGLCAGGCNTGQAPQGRGFLADTSKLHENELSQGMYVQFDKALANYEKVVIEPLAVRFTPQRPLPVALRDRRAAEAAFRAALTQALAEGALLQPVSSVGRNTLLLRAAVTDRFQHDEKEPAPGLATLELEAVDSLSGKRVFAVLDPAFGQRDAGGEHTRPEDAFARFARRLRMRIDEAPYLAAEQR